MFFDIPKLSMVCGPKDDKRTLSITFPFPAKRLGILLSGGMDSALLYYMLVKMANESRSNYKIIPYTILRKEGSPVHAPLVINYVNNLFGLPEQELNIVGDNTLEEPKQVLSGEFEIFQKNQIQVLYLGIIDTQEIHTLNWAPPYRPNNSLQRQYPLKDLTKSHVIDLIVQLGQERLFELTHSCIYSQGRCGTCNGCRERAWGFEQMGYTDPGIL